MKKLFLIFSILLLITGCSWTPERDNPVDPLSQYYNSPPPRNRPPEIGNLHHLIHCQAGSPNICSFEILCQVTDPDNNVRYDSVSVYIDTLYLGNMSYDPGRSAFYLTRSDNDFAGRNIEAFNGDSVWVSVIDDSNAVTTGFMIFSMPILIYPSPQFPLDNDSVFTFHPTLKWFPYGGQAETHTFKITVLYKQLYAAWDTVGLPATDTSVVVTPTLINSSIISSAFYGWYLTVVDQSGHTMTAEPGIFQCFDAPPDTLEQNSFIREHRNGR